MEQRIILKYYLNIYTIQLQGVSVFLHIQVIVYTIWPRLTGVWQLLKESGCKVKITMWIILPLIIFLGYLVQDFFVFGMHSSHNMDFNNIWMAKFYRILGVYIFAQYIKMNYLVTVPDIISNFFSKPAIYFQSRCFQAATIAAF